LIPDIAKNYWTHSAEQFGPYVKSLTFSVLIMFKNGELLNNMNTCQTLSLNQITIKYPKEIQ